jgi:hypothetical protein
MNFPTMLASKISLSIHPLFLHCSSYSWSQQIGKSVSSVVFSIQASIFSRIDSGVPLWKNIPSNILELTFYPFSMAVGGPGNFLSPFPTLLSTNIFVLGGEPYALVPIVRAQPFPIFDQVVHPWGRSPRLRPSGSPQVLQIPPRGGHAPLQNSPGADPGLPWLYPTFAFGPDMVPQSFIVWNSHPLAFSKFSLVHQRARRKSQLF